MDAVRGQVEGAFAVALGQHQRLRAHAAGVPVAVAGAAGGVTGADTGEQQGGQRPQGFRGVGGTQARVVGEGAVDKGGGGVAGGEFRVAQDRRQEAAVVVEAHQHGVFHGADQPAAGFVAAGAEGDDLGQHRVVVAAHFGAVHQAVVNAHALATGRPPAQHRAGLRQVALGRVLGVEAHLHGVAGEPHLLLGQGQGLAGGHPQLPGHQVLAGDQFGDRVLHLQAGVHLQKVELAVRAEQELHGAGAHVIAGLGGVHRRLAHASAQVFVDHRGGRFLHHFLVAALHRAVALAQVDDVTVVVAEHLDLHVAGVDHRPLEDQLIVAEAAFRLLTGAFQLGGDLLRFGDHAHAAPAAAGAGLDHQRQAHGLRFLYQGVVALVLALVAGHTGHAGLLHGDLGQPLGAHQADRLGGRADKGDAGLRAGGGEVRVLGQKAVARVHRVGAAAAAGVQQRRHVQVGLGGSGGADAHRLVGQLHMAGAGVRLGEHRHRAIAQRASALQYPAGDFAAVGDQYFLKTHCHSLFICQRRPCGPLCERASPAKGWLIATRQDPRGAVGALSRKASGIPPASSACLSRAGPAPTRARSHKGSLSQEDLIIRRRPTSADASAQKPGCLPGPLRWPRLRRSRPPRGRAARPWARGPRRAPVVW